MTVPRTLWQPGMIITAGRMAAVDYQSGVVSVSFTSQTSWTESVVFPEAYTAAPVVNTEIASGAGATARWGSRAYNITPTGFTLFLFIMDTANSAATWSDIPVSWTAIAT